MSPAPSLLPFDSLFIAPSNDATLAAALPIADGPAPVQGFGEMLAALTPSGAPAAVVPSVTSPLTGGSSPIRAAQLLSPALPPPPAAPLSPPATEAASEETSPETASGEVEATPPKGTVPDLPPARGVRRREAVAPLPTIDPETGRSVPPGKLLLASRATPEAAEAAEPAADEVRPVAKEKVTPDEADRAGSDDGAEGAVDLPPLPGAVTPLSPRPPMELSAAGAHLATGEVRMPAKSDAPVVPPAAIADPVAGASVPNSPSRSKPTTPKAAPDARRSERVDGPTGAPRSPGPASELAESTVDPESADRPRLRSPGRRGDVAAKPVAPVESRTGSREDLAAGPARPVPPRSSQVTDGVAEQPPTSWTRRPTPAMGETAEFRGSPPHSRESTRPFSAPEATPPAAPERAAAVPALLPDRPVRAVAASSPTPALTPPPSPPLLPNPTPTPTLATVPAGAFVDESAPPPVVANPGPGAFAGRSEPVTTFPTPGPKAVAVAGERAVRVALPLVPVDATPAPAPFPTQPEGETPVPAAMPPLAKDVPAATPSWTPAVGLRVDWSERPGRSRAAAEKSAGPIANGRATRPAIFAEESLALNSGALSAVNQAVKKSPARVGTENAKLTAPMPSAPSSLRAAAPDGVGPSPTGGVSVSTPAPTFPVAATAPADLARETAAASALQAVREVLDVAERLASAPRNPGSVQVRLDDVGVSVRVECRDGEVRATFVTDSSDLRDHLAAAWQAHAASGEGRSFRLADPVFTTAAGSSSTASFSGQGQTSGGDAGRQFTAPTPHAPSFAGSGASPRGSSAGAASAPTAGEVQSAASHRLLAFA